ncbi:TetR family transcriptional regulator [Thermoleophilum album]|jgi:AcrR family transcriptional regulator|uniref:QsdR family transcriptional regulator n=1 Tax=Thermoleophilum album TaxID=29539 RepID=UPI00237CFE5D|nr:QsdR family transcriptional regulator [Thermoleophilum album]WDT93220.1 TetR family transcriptional regulator [Thermoleophilum album]
MSNGGGAGERVYSQAPPPTPLFRSWLAGEPERHVRAFELARSWYLEGRRIEMRALAAELGVSRPTLYRWAGSREQLVADVIWSFADHLFRTAVERARGRGARRILEVARRYTRWVAEAEPLRRFLEADAETALRILTRRHGGVQGRLVAAYEALLREEIERSALTVPLPPPLFAYLIVRVGEAFLYNDAICALEPDVESVLTVIRVLLHSGSASADAA